MAVQELMEQVLASYREQADLYRQMLPVYEEEKIHMIRDGEAAKLEAMAQLALKKLEIMNQIDSRQVAAKLLQQEIMTALRLSDFRVSLLRPHITEEQKAAFQQILTEIGQLLSAVRTMDTDYQHLVREYIKSRRAEVTLGQLSEAVRSYQASIQQGQWFKKS
jgi:hypothetical protein